MEKEKYTIEDLRTGKVGIILTKNKKRFEKIVREAFPEDKYWTKYIPGLGDLELGEEKISYDPDNDGNFLWTGWPLPISIPYISEKDFILPDDTEKETWDSLLEQFDNSFAPSFHLRRTAEDFVIFLKDNYKCKVKKIK
jgi:hypothetical protein